MVHSRSLSHGRPRSTIHSTRHSGTSSPYLPHQRFRFLSGTSNSPRSRSIFPTIATCLSYRARSRIACSPPVLSSVSSMSLSPALGTVLKLVPSGRRLPAMARSPGTDLHAVARTRYRNGGSAPGSRLVDAALRHRAAPTPAQRVARRRVSVKYSPATGSIGPWPFLRGDGAGLPDRDRRWPFLRFRWHTPPGNADGSLYARELRSISGRGRPCPSGCADPE